MNSAFTTSSSDSAAVQQQQQMSTIQILPSDVVDRIAAGEVVQRPASALKELLENSLDAGSTKIVVSVEKAQGGKTGGKKLDFSISDNGCGISKADLPLAATRFATSKLKSVDDFSVLSSFGFRGEALASISMVSHLTITSRTQASPMAFECQYVDGKPQGPSKRCARTPGTTVKVQDLFYNVPHRLKALQPKEEYPRILTAILQPYAVQVARRGIGIVCQQQQARGKTQKMMIDLNTTNLSKVQALKSHNLASSNYSNPEQKPTPEQQAATQQVIANIYGSHLEQHLLYINCQSSNENNDDENEKNNHEQQQGEKDPSTSSSDHDTPKKMQYTCEGFLTAPSLATADVHLTLKSATFLVFVNDRYVECPILKRQLEEIYASRTPWKKAPFIYLNIQVPPNHVDVNVHPTKTQVALLFLEDIVTDIAAKVQELLAEQGRSFGSAKQSRKVLIQNPYATNTKVKNERNSATLKQSGKDDNKGEQADDTVGAKRKRTDQEEEEEDCTSEQEKKKPATQDALQRLKAPPSTDQKPQRRSSSSSGSKGAPSSCKPPPPSQLIRTTQATPVGALEPFLVKTPRSQSQSQTQTTQSKTSSTSSPSLTLTTPSSDGSSDSYNSSNNNNNIIHQPPCPFATESPASDVDLTQPGAFAKLSQQCTCRQAQPATATIMLPKARIVRPANVVPTQCNLHSIRTLRGRVQKHLDKDLQQKLRHGYFVGVVSHHQSLIQWQEEVCLINHTRLAQSLFYQLALARFDDNQIATLGSKIHVQTVIEQVLQTEDDCQDEEHGDALKERFVLSVVSETNRQLAKQATSCLWDNAMMLQDYFGIRFEQERMPSSSDDNDDDVKPVILAGLPILLDGHAPPPHGLPLFLLRLATEVKWEEERPCFDGVCRELGYYYAQLPSTDSSKEEGYKAYVQHTLFPALSYLLLPSNRLQKEATPLTMLSKLYKVFERC